MTIHLYQNHLLSEWPRAAGAPCVPRGGVFEATPHEHAQIQRRASCRRQLTRLPIEDTTTDGWWHATVYLIGGGPSVQALDARDLMQLRAYGRVIAINESVFHVPSDAVFTADLTWWHRRALRLTATFHGHSIVAIPRTHPHMVPSTATSVVYRRGDFNSGLEALYWAASHRPPRIVLVGYDLTERGWWHLGYPWMQRDPSVHYAEWIAQFHRAGDELAADGQCVVNVNLDSGIRCFPFRTLTDVMR